MDSSIFSMSDKIFTLDPFALDYYNSILQYKEHEENEENNFFLKLGEILVIIELNFLEFSKNEILQKILKILHYTVKRTKCPEKSFELCAESFNRLLETPHNDEETKVLMLEFVHQMLISLPANLESERTNYKSSIRFNAIDVYSDSKQIRVRSLICLELLVKKFSFIEILDEIIDYNNLYFPEVYTHFIDILIEVKHIYRNENFWKVCLQHMFNENRKYAFFWLLSAVETISKLEKENFEVEIFFSWSPENSEIIKSSWNSFAAILENLEVNQSHLILPSLQLLEKLKLENIWREFLICEIMQHTNILVLKWSANYVLNNYACTDFENLTVETRNYTKDPLYTVIQGFNNTFLYAGDDSLNSKSFLNFITPNYMKFLKVFVTINWKSIPLDVIITTLETFNFKESFLNPNFLTEILFELAGKIRRIENKIVRLNIRKLFFNLFEHQLLSLDAVSYFKLLELLFNENEVRFDLEKEIIRIKIKSINDCDNIEISLELLKMLFTSNFDLDIDVKIFRIFLEKKKNLEYLLCALNIESTQKEELLKIIENQIKQSQDIKEKQFFEMYLDLFRSNCCNTKLTEAFDFIRKDFQGIGRNDAINFSVLKQIFVDKFVENFLDFHNVLFGREDTEMLLDKGGFTALKKITEILYLKNIEITEEYKVIEAGKTQLEANFLNRILTDISLYSKKFGFQFVKTSLSNVTKALFYFSNSLNAILDFDPTNTKLFFQVYKDLVEQMLLGLHAFSTRDYFASEDGIHFLIRGLLFGESLMGEQRIEYDYMVKNDLKMEATACDVRKMSLKFIYNIPDKNKQDQIFELLRNQLLLESEKLNTKKSRYFKNSKQHRLKLRIIQALALLSTSSVGENSKWNDKYLIPIFEENNQTDVTYIMELIIANTITTDKLKKLLEKGSMLSNSGLISIFAITFMACFKIRESVDKSLLSQFIKLILPWTMGQHFHVRLYAQIAIYHLVNEFNIKEYSFLVDTIKNSLKQGNRENNRKKLNFDFRFNKPNLVELLKPNVIYNLIPRLTNMDLDEWHTVFQHNKDSFLDECKNEYLKKLFNNFYDDKKNEITFEEIEPIENVQRKMNPCLQNELEAGFNAYDCKKHLQKSKDMIVIASLIDKLPNLGGIARTCEVFGLKNLGISSIKYADTKEFKGLSMTAEKWLSLFELKPDSIQNFLIEMKSKGYKIVGAEQTANSESFIDFKFPDKTVLLLGHEKEGIPVRLLSFLDYAVEIPQFGVIRSLNVHVTGALFMWEFCRQHLTRN